MRRVGHAVYVITGPVYHHSQEQWNAKAEASKPSPRPRSIGQSAVWVPDAVFKLVYDPIEQRAWAYWAENRNDTKAAEPISLGSLRQRLNHQWLPQVSNEELLNSIDVGADDLSRRFKN